MSKRFLIWYWSPTGGGGSQYAVKLAQRLARRFGDDAVTLSLHADDPSVANASAHTFETIPAKVVTARRRPIGTAASLPASAQVLAQHAARADCVCCRKALTRSTAVQRTPSVEEFSIMTRSRARRLLAAQSTPTVVAGRPFFI